MAEHAATVHESAEEHESHVGTYLRVFFALLVFTILEYFYAKVFADHFGLLVFGLMALASIKAGLVGMYFMHLKFEGRWIYMMLIPVGILATVVVLGLMPDMVLNENADPGPPAIASPAGPSTA